MAKSLDADDVAQEALMIFLVTTLFAENPKRLERFRKSAMVMGRGFISSRLSAEEADAFALEIEQALNRKIDLAARLAKLEAPPPRSRKRPPKKD